MNAVDSSAWLAYLANEKNADFFAEAIEDTELLIVPAPCVYEVFKVILRERGEDDALQVAALMMQGAVIELDSVLAIEAAVLGHEKNLAFADSVIYATALAHNALLWTQDVHFDGLPGVRYKRKIK